MLLLLVVVVSRLFEPVFGFSPPEGIFAFATGGETCSPVVAPPVSVPLRGFLLLLQHKLVRLHGADGNVSVPLRGFLLLLRTSQGPLIASPRPVSVPLRGFLLLLL